MRVISGRLKGRRLIPPADSRVRPTADRIKESMFNILASKRAVRGSVLDLFSGSGALGIEALSRGANSAVFVDVNPESIRAVKSNLAHTGITDAEIYLADYAKAIKKLFGRKFDLILLDPPYNFGLETAAAELIGRYGLLKEGGVIAAEHSTSPLPDFSDNKYFDADVRAMGAKGVTFLTYKDCEVHNE